MEREIVEVIEPKAVEKKGFVNPFEEGVSYDQFQEVLGKKSVADYCKGELEKDQIDWLTKELEIINKK